ncbi:unnamed protein product [Heligmosomoides polygyrus]|uniref:DDE Tnp4 domain-containing protein n=1 Tax=Heligmosomoides polygyrus TaxID=6339 RepID=A0A183GIN6_HELPZ|nr:unnamed protein product [Heligmosomoides polygyrus]
MHRSIAKSDEKIFTTDPIVNPQNDRILAADKSYKNYNLDSLKAAFTKAWNDLDEDYLRATCDAFVTRLSNCIRAKPGHFE